MELHEDVVRREVILDAERQEAWSALRDLESWLAEEADIELHEGATGELRDADGKARQAVVEEVLPGRRIALRWWADDEDPTIVELTLDDAGEGRTRLVVVELPVFVVQAVGSQIAGGAFRGPAMVAA